MSRLRNPRWRFAAALIFAASVAAVLIGVSQVSARDAASTEPPDVAASTEPSLFAGIEQQGVALGSPNAPVTLVEYADLQCPYCADWSRDALPTVIDDYVKTGKLRIVFHGLAFIGPDSDKALRAAIAAGQEDHLWDVVHGFYLRQGDENSGWVTDEVVSEIAAGVGLDGGQLLAARSEGSVELELKRAAAAANAAGINSTPSFQLGPTGGRLQPLRVSSLGPEGIVPAIEAALAP